jgi:O-antigen/teichoic acid export membrane protein/glycosyltransferase involved in cell wall biosynthesis
MSLVQGTRAALRARLTDARDRSLLRNSAYMMATTVVNSGLGYVFWVVAARGYSPHEVGLATALIAAMTVASLASNFGIGHTLVQRLPRRGDGADWSLTVSTALAGGMLTGVCAGVIVAVALPAISARFSILTANPGYAVALVLGVALWTTSTLLDFIYIAERQTGKMLLRNGAFSALKIPLLALPLLLGEGSALAIFGSWLIGAAVACAISVSISLPKVGRGWTPRLRGMRAEARSMVSSFAGHHLINLGGMLPMYLMPLLVAARLSVTDNGYFYITWMTGGLFFIISPAVAASLFAEGSYRPEELGKRARSSARIIALLLVPTGLVFLLGGREILTIFGRGYARHGTVLLMVLVASALPDAITNISVSVLRVNGKLRQAAGLNLAMAGMAIVLAWFLVPTEGIAGVGWAWLAAQSAGSVFVAMQVLAWRGATFRAAHRSGRDPEAGLRICVIGAGTHFLSGISYHTHGLVTALARQHSLLVILMRRLLPARMYPGRRRVGAPLTELDYGAHVDVFDGVDWFWFPSIIGSIRRLRRQAPDVVVLEWWTGTVLHSYLLLAWLAHRRGARIVVEFHEILDTAEARVPLVRNYVALLARGVLRLADGFVIHSEQDRPRLEATYRLNGKPLVVIPIGPPRLLSNGAKRRHAPADAFNLLFFGTIRPYKGLEDLIRAFDALTPDVAGRCWLTVVGEVWEGWTLPIELIEASRYRDRVTLVNRYVHDDEVAAFFAGCDAVVLPYRRSSASGPLHLAMSAGLPVIVSAVDSLQEAAAQYDGVRFIDPEDVGAFANTIRDVSLLRGLRFRDPHSWSSTGAGFEQLMEELVGRRD